MAFRPGFKEACACGRGKIVRRLQDLGGISCNSPGWCRGGLNHALGMWGQLVGNGGKQEEGDWGSHGFAEKGLDCAGDVMNHPGLHAPV